MVGQPRSASCPKRCPRPPRLSTGSARTWISSQKWNAAHPPQCCRSHLSGRHSSSQYWPPHVAPGLQSQEGPSGCAPKARPVRSLKIGSSGCWRCQGTSPRCGAVLLVVVRCSLAIDGGAETHLRAHAEHRPQPGNRRSVSSMKRVVCCCGVVLRSAEFSSNRSVSVIVACAPILEQLRPGRRLRSRLGCRVCLRSPCRTRRPARSGLETEGSLLAHRGVERAPIWCISA